MLWGNMNNNYCEAAMGYYANSDLTWGAYTSRGWSQPNLVTYMESHDEERQMYKCLKYGASNGAYTTKDSTTALRRAALTATFFYTLPGPKMLWQFGERGYDYSINYPTYTNESRLAQKPPRWDYMKNENRVYLYDLESSLIKLHIENPVFETTDFDLSLTGAMKKIRLRDANNSMVVLGNFDVKDGSITANFYNTGKWYEFFSGDSLDVTSTDMSIPLKAGEYLIYTNSRLPYPYQVDNIKENPTTLTITPNPVTDQCIIGITYPGNANCTVNVFDLNGKQVAKLFSGKIYSKLFLTWQPPTSGMFIVKVLTGDQVKVMKILVSK